MAIAITTSTFAEEKKATKTTRAVAVLVSSEVKEAPEQKFLGQVFFEKKDGKIHVTGKIQGLKPNGVHGFHIHEFGDFTKPDGTSAGGHFNPEDHPHAGPEAAHRHAGDLGNVKADANGVVTLDLMVEGIALKKGDNAIVGRALVLHAGQDDLQSQPSGDAGSRIGVGVIGWANPESKI
ncbi:MAG: superoxide dismutase family protein [Vulcanimicrobiota bacterium]